MCEDIQKMEPIKRFQFITVADRKRQRLAADETLFRKVIAEHGGECETSTSITMFCTIYFRQRKPEFSN